MIILANIIGHLLHKILKVDLISLLTYWMGRERSRQIEEEEEDVRVLA